MFCKFCGSEIPEDGAFCIKCGKVNEPVGEDGRGTVIVRPIACDAEGPEQSEERASAQAQKSAGNKVLIFAIIGIVCALTGGLSCVGLVFSLLARTKLGQYRVHYGATNGSATVGKYLSIAAIVLNVVELITLLVVLVAAIVRALAAI